MSLLDFDANRSTLRRQAAEATTISESPGTWALSTAAAAISTAKKKGDNAAYKELASLIKQQIRNIEWGGDWRTFIDLPHYQLATGKSAAQIRTTRCPDSHYLRSRQTALVSDLFSAASMNQ
jgi:hypothetical protein